MDYSLLLGVHDLDRAVEDAQQVLEVLKVAQVQVQVEEPQHLGADCWQTQVQVEDAQQSTSILTIDIGEILLA